MIMQRVMKLSLPLVILVSTLLSGYSSSTMAQQPPVKRHFLLSQSQDDFTHSLAESDIKDKLLTQYNSWKHVKYLWGGTSKKGIDCSAFVQVTFKEQFGIQLPRSTYYQRNIGKKVSKNQLEVGDLLFFNIKSNVNHIGIYLGSTLRSYVDRKSVVAPHYAHT